MSAISERAVVDIILADFAMVGGDGKLSVVGGGVAVLGFDPTAGVSTRFSLVVAVTVPTELCPAEFPVEVSLYSGGELVKLPDLAGEGSPLRVASIVRLEAPAHPALSVAQREYIGSRHFFVLDLGNGLPLAPGGTYEWRSRIDGDDDHQAVYAFAVAAPPSAPVFG